MEKEDWKQKAHEAFDKYLDALETDLAPESSVAEIERSMLAHYQEMMSETMQLLVERQELFPPSNT